MSDPPPCPFCGGEAEPFAEAGYWWIACHSCGISTGGRQRLSDAETVWNRRTAPPATKKLLGILAAGRTNLHWITISLSRASEIDPALAEWPGPVMPPSGGDDAR